ncbi:hypothetical protein HMPREF0262_02209 [Clostridium sp. ATCC 29733]|nr:hypothetical protein HMPREF0262_02209 [Clostridium sp. ATCC 29733]
MVLLKSTQLIKFYHNLYGKTIAPTNCTSFLGQPWRKSGENGFALISQCRYYKM